MDSVKIFVPYHKLWQFYRTHMEQCQESYVLLAENMDAGYGIYLTEENDLPILYVFLGENDWPELRAELTDELSAEAIASKTYRAFLFSGEFEEDKPDIEPEPEPEGEEMEDEEDIRDEIYAREDELFLASGDFLAAVLRMFDGEAVRKAYGEDLIEDFLEQALMTAADDFGLPVYRPTYLEGEDGESVYVEYPYGEGDGQASPCL